MSLLDKLRSVTATPISGTNVAAPVVPFTDADNYPTHISTYGKGGWHEVETVEQMNEIPTERRIVGMGVFVTSTKDLYIFNGTGWDKFSSSGGGLPPVTEEDNGKILKVQHGQWEVIHPYYEVQNPTGITVHITA